MRTFDWVVTPDPRVMGRLTRLLRHERGGRVAFATAGEALAAAVLATRPGTPLPADALELADAMIGELMLVEAATTDAEDPDRRVRIALAAAVLSAVRPHTARVCDHAIEKWMGFGIGSPRRMENPYALAGRVLLSLLLDDADAAADTVDVLMDIDRTGVAGILHDWVVARVQLHGHDREAQCFHHLRLSLSQTPGGGDGAALLMLGAIVLLAQAGEPRRRTVEWLDNVAVDLSRNGTTHRSVQRIA